MGIGVEFVLVIGFCAFLGWLADQAEGTSPGWMILGFFAGFGIMFYTMLQRAKRDDKAEREEEEERMREEEKDPPENKI